MAEGLASDHHIGSFDLLLGLRKFCGCILGDELLPRAPILRHCFVRRTAELDAGFSSKSNYKWWLVGDTLGSVVLLHLRIVVRVYRRR